MKLICLITGEIEYSFEIAQAWQNAGAPGVTIIRAFGLYGLESAVANGEVELPHMVSSMASALAATLASVDQHNTMLLCLCDDGLRAPLVAAAQAVLGDMTQPGHGVLFVIDVESAFGVRNHGVSRS